MPVASLMQTGHDSCRSRCATHGQVHRTQRGRLIGCTMASCGWSGTQAPSPREMMIAARASATGKLQSDGDGAAGGTLEPRGGGDYRNGCGCTERAANICLNGRKQCGVFRWTPGHRSASFSDALCCRGAVLVVLFGEGVKCAPRIVLLLASLTFMMTTPPPPLPPPPMCQLPVPHIHPLPQNLRRPAGTPASRRFHQATPEQRSGK